MNPNDFKQNYAPHFGMFQQPLPDQTWLIS